jgi:hypothetical protein
MAPSVLNSESLSTAAGTTRAPLRPNDLSAGVGMLDPSGDRGLVTRLSSAWTHDLAHAPQRARRGHLPDPGTWNADRRAGVEAPRFIDWGLDPQGYPHFPIHGACNFICHLCEARPCALADGHHGYASGAPGVSHVCRCRLALAGFACEATRPDLRRGR